MACHIGHTVIAETAGPFRMLHATVCTPWLQSLGIIKSSSEALSPCFQAFPLKSYRSSVIEQENYIHVTYSECSYNLDLRKLYLA